MLNGKTLQIVVASFLFISNTLSLVNYNFYLTRSPAWGGVGDGHSTQQKIVENMLYVPALQKLRQNLEHQIEKG